MINYFPLYDCFFSYRSTIHDSCRFLESKVKYLEAGKQSPDWGQTESASPTLNSDGTQSSSIRISTDEQSVASYSTDNTRTRTTSSLCEHHQETETKPRVLVSSDHDKDSSIEKQAEAGFTITRKKRGLRKRKGRNEAVKEGSVGDSDNLGSSTVVPPSQKDATTPGPDHDPIRDDSPTKNKNLMEIFGSIAESEPALVFRHRMDGQVTAKILKFNTK